jgi:hypothetical protein
MVCEFAYNMPSLAKWTENRENDKTDEVRADSLNAPSPTIPNSEPAE